VRFLLRLVLLLILLAGVAGELLLPSLIESRVEQQVRANTDDVAVVEAEVGSFPFLPSLLLDGRVDSLDVELLELADQQVSFGDVHFGLEGIQLDRDVLLGGQLHVTDIDVGYVRIEVVDERLRDTMEAVEDLGPEAVRLRDRVLELAPEGAQAVEIPIDDRLLPCTPDVEVEGDLAVFSCEFHDVPPVLLEAALG
jgi:hypothetical protein